MSAKQYRVTCPTCGAPPEQQCRSLTKGRLTDTHRSRIDAAYTTTTEETP